MNKENIRDRLVEHGKKLFSAPSKPYPFSKHPEADALLNDLERFPHAFVLACIMDRQVKAEKAWLIPYRIMEKIGGFSIDMLGALSKDEVNRLMTEPEPLHRFATIMSANFFSAIQRIKRNYGGNAANIWDGKPSSAEVVYRFLEFEGVGPKIVNMAANALARHLIIPFSDYYSIDISADVHVRRVFSRLGLCGQNPTVEQVIYKARALYPEFPGIMDFPCWEIGRNWCKPNNPVCSDCYMNDLCPTPNRNSELLALEGNHKEGLQKDYK